MNQWRISSFIHAGLKKSWLIPPSERLSNGWSCEWSLAPSESVCVCRYDVELFQRIETLIGKKLPAFPTQEEEVMMLVERVSEAQRFARIVRPPAMWSGTVVWWSVCVTAVFLLSGDEGEQREEEEAQSGRGRGRRAVEWREEDDQGRLLQRNARRRLQERKMKTRLMSVVSPSESNKCCILFSFLCELSL